MAPDKLEQHIRVKLQQREIAPSERAWQRISEGLQHTAPKQRQKGTWYAIAASFVALVSLSLFYFQNASVGEPKATGVVVSKPNRPEQGAGISGVKEQKEEEVMVKDPAQRAFITETAMQKERVPSGLAVMAQSPNKDLDAGKIDVEPMESAMAPGLVQVSEAVLSEKITEVMAQVQQMEQTQGVSEAEIDSLLHAAQKAIITERLFTKSNEVNAMALLAEVEEELDQSFRDQIFESLKAGFLKVRTAVADRNN
jgi:hypothetical protein